MKQKNRRERVTTPAPNTTCCCNRYYNNDSAQPDAVYFRWKAHAEFLLREYFRTGRTKHLCAFVVHIITMRSKIAADERWVE